MVPFPLELVARHERDCSVFNLAQFLGFFMAMTGLFTATEWALKDRWRSVIKKAGTSARYSLLNEDSSAARTYIVPSPPKGVQLCQARVASILRTFLSICDPVQVGAFAS